MEKQNIICFWNVTEQHGGGILGGIQEYECILSNGDRETVLAHDEDELVKRLIRDRKIEGVELAARGEPYREGFLKEMRK
ncbi:hypothetical protein KAT51_06945 [bacterium]|nr:hypothetical protein [bacterium]